jgi:hypothetical protein
MQQFSLPGFPDSLFALAGICSPVGPFPAFCNFDPTSKERLVPFRRLIELLTPDHHVQTSALLVRLPCGRCERFRFRLRNFSRFRTFTSCFKAAQHWNLAQRPFYRSPIGPALASCHQLEPHPAQGENSDKAELRHITPVRAYISLTLLVFSSLSGHSPNVTLSSRATPRQAYGFS